MMNKAVSYILVAVAMLAAACSCSKAGGEGDAALMQVSFRVHTPVEADVRASIDSDGVAANVNRYIMEVYRVHNGESELYSWDFQMADKNGTVFEVPLVVDQYYDILFWADCGTDLGGDIYYDTWNGLRNVKFIGEYCGNDDRRDAFSRALSLTPDSTALSHDVMLTRPFGQLNIITSDIDTLAAQTESSGRPVIPDSVKVTFSAPDCFDVLTQKASGSRNFTYVTVPYYVTSGMPYDYYRNLNDSPKFTLSMDYILAPTEESSLSRVEISASQFDPGSGNRRFCVENSYDNVPLCRNWRTNIIGGLLTVNNDFQIIVDPLWTEPGFHIDAE